MHVEVWNLLIVYYVVFFITAVFLLFKLTPDMATKSERNSFQYLILLYMAYLAVNLSCMLQLNGVIFPPRLICYAICFFSLLTVIFNGVALYHFIMMRFLKPLPFSPRCYVTISITPLTVMMVCLILSFTNGMVFSLDENNAVVYGPAYSVLTIGSLFYYLAIIALLLHRLAKKNSYNRRQQALTSLGAVLLLIAAILVNTLFRSVSILPPVILITIVILFINMQEDVVHTDALTGMNNRRKANEYIGGLIENLSEEKPLILYMCDINRFKQINGRYGHAEGDKALLLVAKTLKTVIDRYEGFAARFGGDEFLLSHSTKDTSSDTPQELIKSINQMLSDACKKADCPYTLSLCIGHTLCTDPSRPLQDYIYEADQDLYVCKRKFHAKK